MEGFIDWLNRSPAFMPVLARVGAFLALFPPLNRGTPMLARAAFAFLVALLIFPVMPVPPAVPESLMELAAAVLIEALTGLAMGLMVQVVFAAFYVAGQVIDVPMGFGMVNVVDPQTGQQIPIVAQLHYLLAMLVFLGFNGHHTLLMGLAQSFQLIPPGAAFLAPAAAQVMVEAVALMFYLAFRMALPVLASIFVIDVSLGVIARSVPQVNVFVAGFTLKIGVGLTMLYFAMGAFVLMFISVLGPGGHLADQFLRLISALGMRP